MYIASTLCSSKKDFDSLEMGLEDWEYLSDNNLFNSQATQEDSRLVHEHDQHQVANVAQIDENQSDEPVKEIREITEEGDAVPQIQLRTKEVEFEENEMFEDEKSELEFSESTEFQGEEMEEVEGVEGVESNGNDCMKGHNQNVSKWARIGVLSSVGVLAASLTMFILGGCKRNQKREPLTQIYDGDKVKMLVHHFFCKILGLHNFE